MPMMKGYCTNCNKDNEVRRIFDVNSDVRFCYCPHCGKKYRPKVAISNYTKRINHYLKRSYYYLKNVGDPLAAYNLFAYVMELEPKNKVAKLGRLSSLCYLSTVRRNRFLEVRELLDMEKDDFHSKDITMEYATTLLGLEKCTELYLKNVKNRLTMRTYFFDVACIKLYYKHVREAIELRRLIVSELSAINEEKLASDVSDRIKVLEMQYNDIIFTVDGQDHTLVNFTKNGEPLITNGRRRIDTKLSRYRMSTLDQNNKKLNIIPDRVFTKVYINMFKAYKVSLPLAIINALIGLTLLVFYFILIKYACAPYVLGVTIFFLVLSLTFVAINPLFFSILKKPRI